MANSSSYEKPFNFIWPLIYDWLHSGTHSRHHLYRTHRYTCVCIQCPLGKHDSTLRSIANRSISKENIKQFDLWHQLQHRNINTVIFNNKLLTLEQEVDHSPLSQVTQKSLLSQAFLTSPATSLLLSPSTSLLRPPWTQRQSTNWNVFSYLLACGLRHLFDLLDACHRRHDDCPANAKLRKMEKMQEKPLLPRQGGRTEALEGLGQPRPRSPKRSHIYRAISPTYGQGLPV